MNAVERAVVLTRSGVLDTGDLAFMMEHDSVSSEIHTDKISQNLSLEDIEKKSILETLGACSGNKSEAARRLGITRKTLRTKLQKYQADQ
jgi:two-component system response regulator HydG